MLKIENLFPGSFGANCYLLCDGSHAAVIDASARATTILDACSALGARLDYILLTHGHFDHITSVDALRDEIEVPVCIHAKDADFLTDSHKNAFYPLFGKERIYRKADKLLAEGDVLTLGDSRLRVLCTPGHTQGSVCFLVNNELLFTGDTLFDGGYGRCDLFGGDVAAMKQSLLRLQGLDPALRIYPGHGKSISLGAALDKIWN